MLTSKGFFLRPECELGEWQIDADPRVQKEGGTDQKEQQKQKDKIHQRDDKDQERVQMNRSREFHRCSPAALELGSNSIMDELG
jgi:hypothetical protein